MSVGLVGTIIFILGYIGITLEHPMRINKAAFALLIGGVLWMLVGISDPHTVEDHIVETGYDIFNITVFLLAAMSLVEVLIHYRLFDVIKSKLLQYNFGSKSQFLILNLMAFILSGIVDNLTATIILIQIARKFFWGRNLLVSSVGIVISANAGGAFSPIGDVTTIMLWIAGKFSAGEIIIDGFLPCFALLVTSSFLLGRKIKEEKSIKDEFEPEKLTRGERLVISVTILSFFLPLLAKSLHLPPVVGILLGVGLTWIVVDSIKNLSKCRTHLTATIESLVQKTDIASIKFFVGILLAVSALNALGVLDKASHFIYGETQEISRVIIGNTLMGMISSVLDNIPLTAIAINILETEDPILWVLLAISVGTGGSLLPIGSAAGVIAMGMIKELTFKEYVKIGFIPALLSFLVAIGVWSFIFFI